MKHKRKRASRKAAAVQGAVSKTYDKMAKDILSMRNILAPVLKETVPEFRELSIETIAKDCIEQGPWIGTIPVDPGMTNRYLRRRMTKKIRGLSTEQSEPYEGYVTFDLLFYARVPGTDKRIKLLINLEAQRKRTNYKLVKRAVFYASRLISSQKGRDFAGQDYDNICKVYTIWLCFYLPKGEKSSMTHYEFREVNDIGDHHESKSDYDLINVTTIHVGNDENPAKLMRFLRLVFLSRLSEEALAQKLKDEFGVETDDATKKELRTMCNLSEGLKEESRIETWAESVKNLMKNMKWTAQQAIEAIAVPVQYREEVLDMIG